MKKGVFCISLDTELLWGRRGSNWQDFVWRAEKVRPIVKRILKLFEKYEIPATWAVVGQLFLKPKKQENHANLWHAPDIVKELKKHNNQEIACHSLSHPEFDKITREEAEQEIKRCVELAKKENVKLSSFVFPKNKICHLDILKKYGFKTFRGAGPREWELLFPSSPPVFAPKIEHGLFNIPGSMYFVSARGMRKYLPFGLRILKSRLGINHAISKKQVFHLWFHPIDLADSPKKLLFEIEKILAFAAKNKNKGLLEIKTMEDIASDLLV